LARPGAIATAVVAIKLGAFDVTEIARSEGVVASLLYRWRRQFAAERETTTFLPVRFSRAERVGACERAICAPPPAPKTNT
jgi:transposase-like protein